MRPIFPNTDEKALLLVMFLFKLPTGKQTQQSMIIVVNKLRMFFVQLSQNTMSSNETEPVKKRQSPLPQHLIRQNSDCSGEEELIDDSGFLRHLSLAPVQGQQDKLETYRDYSDHYMCTRHHGGKNSHCYTNGHL